MLHIDVPWCTYHYTNKHACVTKLLNPDAASRVTAQSKWLTYCSRGEFITLLTFKLSSFRERLFSFAAFSVLLPLIPLVERLKAREGRIEITDTQTQDNYCNPRRACTPRVNYTVKTYHNK